jgi:AraC family transcriptional regulator
VTNTVEQIVLGQRVRSAKVDGAHVIEASYEPGTRLRPHAHGRANITLLLRGQIEETVGRDTAHARTLSVVLKPAGTVHENRFGPDGAHTLVIELDDQEAHFHNAASARWRWFDGGEVAAAAMRLFLAFRAGAVELETLDVLAAIEATFDHRARTPRPSWLDRARQLLQDAPDQRVSASRLAREFDLHPVYLARAFRAAFGCSMSRYREYLRVRRAAHEIASSAAPLSRVAIDNGFADQPHLSRVFKRHASVAPGRFRRLVRA